MALLFIVSAITWSHRGDLLLGKPIIGPTYLDHGYNYYNGSPPLITIIDVGQPVFLFFVGFSAYIAFSSRLRKRGQLAAAGYALQRIIALYLLSMAGQLVNDLGGGTDLSWTSLWEQFNWKAVLLTDVLAVIACGAGATYAAIFLVRGADQRAWLALTLLIVHAFLYATFVVEHQPFIDSVLGAFDWPLRLLSLSALAILGSAFGQWIHDSRDDIRQALRQRVIPVACGCLALSYSMEWVQPGDHHQATMALVLLAAGVSGLLLLSTIAVDQMGLELPLLTALGKNLLLVFIIAGILYDFYFAMIPDWIVYGHPYGALFFVGLLPIVLIVLLTRFLETRNIALRV